MKIALLNLLFVASFFYSCQPKSESTETTEPADDTALTRAREVFFTSLVAPTEVAARLQATGAEYNGSLRNDPTRYAQYAGNEVKAAANLGIYLADLNYAVAFQAREDSRSSFEAAHALSNAIGIEKSILDYLKTRYDENLEQNDSVKAVVEDMFGRATNNLKDTDRERLVGIAMAGYNIENLHLALGIIESFPKDVLPEDARINILVPVFQMVLNQQANIEVTYDYLKSITDPEDPDQNPNYPYYANAFEELLAVYNRLDVSDKIANNQGSELLSDEVVAELSEKVDAIRSKAVSVE